jgi:hypothetical protein
MLPSQEGAEGYQEAGENPARSRHCNRGANPRGQATALLEGGKAGGEQRSGSQETGPPPENPTRGEDPEKEESMEKRLGRQISLGELPLWSWLTLALLLLALFLLLSASGALLAPLLGQAADVTNYLHEFAHDGRHLLGVPCH